jgi:hypothetical protein
MQNELAAAITATSNRYVATGNVLPNYSAQLNALNTSSPASVATAAGAAASTTSTTTTSSTGSNLVGA